MCVCVQALAQNAEQVALQQVHSTAADMQALHQQLAAALATAAIRQQSLEAAAAEAHAAAAAAQQLQQQQQLQQRDSNASRSSSVQELPPLLLPEYDEAAAAAASAPWHNQVLELLQAVTKQQAITNELQGQLKAAKHRRLRYEKLQGHEHNDVITLGSSSSSSGEVAAAANRQGLQPVCEQCLQPIDAELYRQ